MIAEKNKVVSWPIASPKTCKRYPDWRSERNPTLRLFVWRGNLIPGFEQNVNKLKVGRCFALVLRLPMPMANTIKKVLSNCLFLFSTTMECLMKTFVNRQHCSYAKRRRSSFQRNYQGCQRYQCNHGFQSSFGRNESSFHGSVIDIREATANEIEKGHVHQDHDDGIPAAAVASWDFGDSVYCII